MSETRTTQPSSVMGRRWEMASAPPSQQDSTTRSKVPNSARPLVSKTCCSNSPLWQRAPSSVCRLTLRPGQGVDHGARSARCGRTSGPCGHGRRRSGTAPPAWPKGVWPRSCPSAMASMRSRLSPSARPMSRGHARHELHVQAAPGEGRRSPGTRRPASFPPGGCRPGRCTIFSASRTKEGRTQVSRSRSQESRRMAEASRHAKGESLPEARRSATALEASLESRPVSPGASLFVLPPSRAPR